MSQPDPQPELLLFHDKEGRKAQFQDVVDDGLDGGYEDRIPHLIRLAKEGTPYERLLATAMLAAWCRPEGFQAIREWATRLDSVPWKDTAVTYDRVYGVDSAFQTLADAIQTSYYCDSDFSRLRFETIEVLLLYAYSRVYFDRTLALAIMRDKQYLARFKLSIQAAFETSLSRLRNDDKPEFDLAFQTASLLMPLARIDDSVAANDAIELINIAPGNEKMLREVANGMAEGSGAETAKVLHRLEGLSMPSIEPDLRAALRRRSLDGSAA